ncbi:uncharacterized protein Tco025E_02643 [Trypanosoma conorhini]|uniref:Uncharacterized protein n=1 Tax=Trypanosoma conorhini TaxID=83891 RepID=A0A3R7PE32_9TRYP|nr:uncharacterized protein Tco025E_02643 [Trypanosoma conorhini]RNF24086.1 hypothetical protein Tco025E_02643 [Trypanosoma conorhini]
MEGAQSSPSRREASLAAPRASTASRAPAGRAELLSQVLAFFPAGLSRDAGAAAADAEALLRRYEGLEEELLSALREKYGQPPHESIERARELLHTSPTIAAQEPTAPPAESLRADVDAPAEARSPPILARMRREREAEDATWRRVHAAAKELLVSLEEAQRRVAEQEVELARLTAEHSRRLREGAAEEREQEALRSTMAAAATRLQLTLLRLRGAVEADVDGAAALGDVEYKRHMLSAQRREEEDLIEVYRRVLRQHVRSYPLSPLCEEIGRVDAQLRQLLPESPV